MLFITSLSFLLSQLFLLNTAFIRHFITARLLHYITVSLTSSHHNNHTVYVHKLPLIDAKSTWPLRPIKISLELLFYFLSELLKIMSSCKWNRMTTLTAISCPCMFKWQCIMHTYRRLRVSGKFVWCVFVHVHECTCVCVCVCVCVCNVCVCVCDIDNIYTVLKLCSSYNISVEVHF